MIKIYVANLGKYNEGKLVGAWITLPVSEEELQEILTKEVGINEQYEEYAIHDFECDFMEISEYSSISELNELAELLEGLEEYQEKTLKAIIEWGYYGKDIKEAIENIDNFSLNEDIQNDYDLGYYYINEAGIYDLEAMGNLANYIDYEAFGRDIHLENESFYSEYGYIEYIG